MAAHIKMLQFTRGTASELKKIIFFKHSKKQCIYAYHIYTIKYTKTHGIHSNNGVQEICNVSWNQEMAKAATSAKEYYLTLHPSMKKKARSSVNKHITNNKIRRKNEKRKVSEKGFFFFFFQGGVLFCFDDRGRPFFFLSYTLQSVYDLHLFVLNDTWRTLLPRV